MNMYMYVRQHQQPMNNSGFMAVERHNRANR